YTPQPTNHKLRPQTTNHKPRPQTTSTFLLLFFFLRIDNVYSPFFVRRAYKKGGLYLRMVIMFYRCNESYSITKSVLDKRSMAKLFRNMLWRCFIKLYA